ncbi:MAG: hypothetical protein ACRD27_11140, partial [Terracidiphilus sp.]
AGAAPAAPTLSSVLPVLRKAANELLSRLHFHLARLLAAARVQVLDGIMASIEDEAGELLL